MRPKKLILYIAIVSLALMGYGGHAAADTVYYYFDTNSSATGAPPDTSPWGYVTVTLVNSTTANITFTPLDGLTFTTSNPTGQGNNYTYIAAVNVNGTSTVSNISYTGTLVGTLSAAGTQNMDNTGSFTQTIEDNTTGDTFPPQSSLTSVSFTLTDTSGTWTSAGRVLTGNSGHGHEVASQLDGTGYIVDNNGGDNGGLGYFTAAPAGDPTTTPEPATLILVGSSLAGFVGNEFRKRAK